MDGKDAIIKKIIDDAEAKCRAAENVAQSKAENILKTAENWAENYSAAQEEILARETAEIVSRRLTVADLDVRKTLLAAKQRVVSEAFELALKKLCALDDKAYLAFVEKLIEKYAGYGDTIMLSNDCGIAVDTIKKLKAFTAKDLKVSPERGNFKGGIRIIGKTCDIDLSFSALIDEKKASISAEVLKILFSGGKTDG